MSVFEVWDCVSPFLSKSEGLTVWTLVSPLGALAGAAAVVAVDSGGMAREVTTWVTKREKNFSSRYNILN